jgi:hypothetical protein
MDRNDIFDEKQARDYANPVYTPFQIGLATFFGTILAGLTCLAINFKTLKNDKAYKFTILASFLLVPTIIVAFILIPDTRYDRLLTFGMALVMAGVANLLQGKEIAIYLNQGSTRQNYWKVGGIIAVSLLIVLIILVSIVKLFGLELPV